MMRLTGRPKLSCLQDADLSADLRVVEVDMVISKMLLGRLGGLDGRYDALHFMTAKPYEQLHLP